MLSSPYRRSELVAVFARHVLISSLKNEGPFILEWVAHHRVLGFDAIYVASNDCSDGSDALLAALDRAGIIGHVPNEVAPGVIPQHAGYDRIRATHAIDRAEWLMMLDTDEFLNIHIGQNRVQDLTDRAGTADIIAVSARSFSDLPQTHWKPGPVTCAFPMALGLTHRANQSVKTLTRDPARFRGIHNHHMVGYRGKTSLQVFCAQNGSSYPLERGTPLGDKFRHIPKEQVGYDLAQYNHYPIKTLDSYLLRQARGRGAAAKPDAASEAENNRHTMEYFTLRAGRGQPEHSIRRYDAEVEALIATLLADPQIATAQRTCEAAHAAAARAHVDRLTDPEDSPGV
jgi:hypothetical protein